MPGLAEGMEGVKAGETREIKITFPDKLGPQGGDLEGTKAIFEVEAVEIRVSKQPSSQAAPLLLPQTSWFRTKIVRNVRTFWTTASISVVSLSVLHNLTPYQRAPGSSGI